MCFVQHEQNLNTTSANRARDNHCEQSFIIYSPGSIHHLHPIWSVCVSDAFTSRRRATCVHRVQPSPSGGRRAARGSSGNPGAEAEHEEIQLECVSVSVEGSGSVCMAVSGVLYAKYSCGN